MKQIYNSTLRKIFADGNYKKIAAPVFVTLFIAAAVLAGTRPFMTGPAILTISLSMFLTGTLIYKSRRRRRCLNRIE